MHKSRRDQVGEEKVPISVEFLPVGDSNGDAIVIKYGDDSGFYLNVVDAGYTSVGEEVVKHIEKTYGKDVTISNMVVSHADNDHAKWQPEGPLGIFIRARIAALRGPSAPRRVQSIGHTWI